MGTNVKPYNEQDSKKEQVATMFNNIAKTYDFLNHFLSLGIDIIWRKKAIKELKALQPKLILDVATGTGDFAFEALSLNPTKIIGVDISQGMLAIAQEKISKRNESHRFEVRLGDSERLLFEDNTFDAITVSFGVRNFENLDKGLSDMFRVLRKDGKLVILEFSNPKNFPVKQFYNFYSFKLLPLFGKLFSNDAKAYTYLPESVKAFPDGEDFLTRMKTAGFTDTKCKVLGFGICSIYTGLKSEN
jgi:demethylmenaquinone methyltransferase/2-methoxy-6-polyprenyl-1,4-benzoquinol methylase